MPEAVEMTVNEETLHNMMSSTLVNQVAEMLGPGELDRIKSALEKKLRLSGCGYKSARELAEAAMKEEPTVTRTEELQQQQPSTSTMQQGSCPKPSEEKPAPKPAENMDVSLTSFKPLVILPSVIGTAHLTFHTHP